MEGPGLKQTTLEAADACTIEILRKNTGEVLHFMKRWELGSKPRGRQEIQNWLSTPANSAVGTVITTASCQIKPTQIHAAMQQKKYIMRAHPTRDPSPVTPSRFVGGRIR